MVLHSPAFPSASLDVPLTMFYGLISFNKSLPYWVSLGSVSGFSSRWVAMVRSCLLLCLSLCFHVVTPWRESSGPTSLLSCKRKRPTAWKPCLRGCPTDTRSGGPKPKSSLIWKHAALWVFPCVDRLHYPPGFVSQCLGILCHFSVILRPSITMPTSCCFSLINIFLVCSL